MRNTALILVALLVLTTWTACNSQADLVTAETGATGIQVVAAHTADTTQAPQPASTSMPPETEDLPKSEGQDQLIRGTVTEVIEASQYVYVCVNSGSESRWVATNSLDVKSGDSVEFEQGLLMRNFKSPSMGRVFPAILFVQGLQVTSRPTVQVTAVKGLPSGHPSVPKSARTAAREVARPNPGSIPRLKDTLTIEAIQKDQEALNGKAVSVVGMVTKVSANIMDRNWIHLVDEDGRELVVTSSATAVPGSIQVARGTLVVGKAFETGYYVPLLLENSTLDSAS